MAQNNNIIIDNPGVNGESGNIRIGIQGTQSSCQIAGTYGSIMATNAPVFCDSTGKLGTIGGSGGVFGSNAFLFYLGQTVSGVTGDGTTYYLGSTTHLTSLFNNAGTYANIGTGSGICIVPVNCIIKVISKNMGCNRLI